MSLKDFQPEDITTFVSILDEDWECRYGGRPYKIAARASVPFRVEVAIHFAKHMADLVLQRDYDVESKKLKSQERRNRARLFIDPRRWELYEQILPDLVEYVREFKNSAGKELLQRPDPTKGIPEIKS